MKITILSIFCIILFAGSVHSDYKWKSYENPLLITKYNAGSIDSFENTPESMVTYFYASRIRKDSKWEKVLPDEKNRSDRLKLELTNYAKWTITQFRLVSKTEYAKNKFWIKVFVEILYKGKKDSGEDEVTVELINGKWIITSIPI